MEKCTYWHFDKTIEINFEQSFLISFATATNAMATMMAASFLAVNFAASLVRVGRHKIRIIVIYGKYIIMLMLTLNTHNTPKYMHKSEDGSADVAHSHNTHTPVTHRHVFYFSALQLAQLLFYDFIIIRIHFMWRVFRFRRSAQSVVDKIN